MLPSSAWKYPTLRQSLSKLPFFLNRRYEAVFIFPFACLTFTYAQRAFYRIIFDWIIPSRWLDFPTPLRFIIIN
jgi:hypothetical protein